MKYGMMARVYGWAFDKVMKDYYKTHDFALNGKNIRRETLKEYRSIIERTPGVGKSPLASSLVGACYFVALIKTVPDMTSAKFDEINFYIWSSSLMVKVFLLVKKQGILFKESIMNKKVEAGIASQDQDLEMGWKYTFEKGHDEYWCTYTKCGICRLCEREDVAQYASCMCKMDYPMLALQGGTLYRTCTLANGQDYCDFHVIKCSD